MNTNDPLDGVKLKQILIDLEKNSVGRKWESYLIFAVSLTNRALNQV